ncbi:MAG: lipoprotein [Pseudohongiella sp.]|nr:MAG: lipoprotein [Pseudohongiella sp.]
MGFWFLTLLFLASSTSITAQEPPRLPSAVTNIEPTVVSFVEYNDPYESLNRRVFAFNDTLYKKALIPLSNGYQRIVPPPARESLIHVFRNLREPLNAIYHSAQGEFRPAGKNLLRFLVNSTIGVVGLFDPAESWLQLEEDASSLNETLMVHGVAQGPFIVLPLLGLSDARNAGSRLTESFYRPVSYISENPETTALIAFDIFQIFAPAAESYLTLTEESNDPYLYMRNQYLQSVARDQETIDAK